MPSKRASVKKAAALRAAPVIEHGRGYEAGGPVGRMQAELREHMHMSALALRAPIPSTAFEKAIATFSRAMGPALLIAGYCAIAKILFF